MRKGIQLAPHVEPELLNQLHADWWTGMDAVVGEMRDPAQHYKYAALAGEYVHRVPHDISPGEAAQVRLFPGFRNAWIIGNEGDGWRAPAEEAALYTASVTNILSANPSIENVFVFASGSQWYDRYGAQRDQNYALLVWSFLLPAIRAQFDALAGHFYLDAETGGRYDESRTRDYLLRLCATATAMGLTRVWLPEHGWSLHYVAADGKPKYPQKASVAAYWTRFVEMAAGVPMLKRYAHYTANAGPPTDEYLPLVENGALNPVGQTFAGL